MLALSIANDLEWLLSKLGDYDIRKSRNNDSYVSLTDRCNAANKWGADIFVSIHLNADPDDDSPGTSTAKGEEIWIYPGATKARVLAQYVEDELLSKFPDEPFRGIKEDDLAVCRQTKMPSILIETGFIDNAETARKLAEPAVRMRMAQCIADGIEAYFRDPSPQPVV